MPNFTTAHEKYDWLSAAYDNNNLYEDVRKFAINNSTWIEALKPLRTVVNRSVEFYVAKIFPDIQPKILSENPSLEEAIYQITNWSNFAGKKQLFLRNLALFGDLFVKVNVEDDKVYYENISPKYVTSFRENSRGYLQEIRLDLPIVLEGQNYLWTEYWTKESFSIWIHQQHKTTPLRDLGQVYDFGFTSELGIDFVPFVHVKFRDTGDPYGKACAEHAIDKITEANRQSTRLQQMLFRHNKALWAVTANSVDSDGIALPAPKIKEGTGSGGDDVAFTDNTILYLPGAAKLEGLVPDINYGDALLILQDMMNELEQDLPELKYYSLKDGNLSGKAISLLLGAAFDRAKEARDNFIQGMVRANEMALTMGVKMGVLPSNVGNFEAGDFDHSIMVESFFTSDLEERAGILKTLIESGLPLEEALKIAGFETESN